MRIRSKNLHFRTTSGEAVHPLLAVTLVIVAVGAGGTWMWNAWETARLNGNMAAPPPAQETGKISLPQSALTNDSVRALITPWLRQAWQAEGLRDPASTLIPAEKWKPFVTAAIAEELDGPEKVSRVRLNSLAMDLSIGAEKHPVAAAVVGHALPAGETRQRLLKVAFEALSKQKGSEALTWHVACDMALAPEKDDVKAGIRALEALRAALAASSGFSGDHDQLAGFQLVHGSRMSFFNAMHEDFWHVVEAAKDMKPWLRSWIEGLHHVQAGWDARGGGYENNVTRRGWKVFDDELSKARTCLESAWKEKPKHAGPAVTLIYSCLNQKEKSIPNMRHWFDEAVQVHADNEEAYRNVLWGMRPRWHGNHPLMQSFGEQCLKTGRFDTDAPWFFAVAHMDCASEWDLPDYYFREFTRKKELSELVNGYEASPARAAWRAHDRTQAVVWDFKCGLYREAQSWLEKLNFQPDERVLEDWGGLEKDFVVGKTAAFAGDTGAALRDAERAEEGFHSARARDLYKTGLDSAKDLSPLGRSFLRNRVAKMDAEARFAAGEKFFPATAEDFAGWAKAGDGWNAAGDSIQRMGKQGPAGLTHMARIGPRFELSGEVEITEPGDLAEAWITFGYPPPSPNPRWGAVRLVLDHGLAHAVLSTELGDPEHQSNVEAAPRYAFVLHVGPQAIDLTVNGKKVWQGVIQIDSAVKENYAQFGLGSTASVGRTQVKFSKLLLRKT